MVFARATEVPWKEGLTNTLDRAGVSGYKFLAAQAVVVTVVGTIESYAPKHLPPRPLRP
jgi:hypothetical protein